MYKSGGSSFDRSIYLKLYNGPERHGQHLKGQNIELIEPRLSILAATHAERVIDMIEDEKNFQSDGFISRFRIVCARPIYTRVLEMKEYKNPIKLGKLIFFYHIKILNLHNVVHLIKIDILYFILKYIHKTVQKYTFDHDANYIKIVWINIKILINIIIYNFYF